MSFLVSFLLSLLPISFAQKSDGIVGHWQYYKFYYQGEIQDPPNPNLVLQFEFFADGSNRLYWTRKGESDFCERRGEYIWQNNLLQDEVKWTNPDNAVECYNDPDMREGHKTITQAELKNGEFWLYFYLGDEPLVYIWKRLD